MTNLYISQYDNVFPFFWDIRSTEVSGIEGSESGLVERSGG